MYGARPSVPAMTFCVECGAEGKTYDALCGPCYARKHPVLASRPPFVDVVECAHCGRLEVSGSWVNAEVDDVLPDILSTAVPQTGSASNVVFTHVSRREDDRNRSATVTATGFREDLELVESFQTRVRLRGATCPTCSRLRGGYYESILQLRSQGGTLTEERRAELLALVESLVARRKDRGEEAFVSRIEDVRGGTDVYLSSNGLGHAIAREVASTFHGTVRSSPKLHGQRKGKTVYRVTYVVRLPESGA